MTTIVDELRRIVHAQATPEAVAWFESALVRADDRTQLLAAFAGAGRRLGTKEIGAKDAARIAAAGLAWPAVAGVDECGRAALLIAATEPGKWGPTPFPATRPVVRDSAESEMGSEPISGRREMGSDPISEPLVRDLLRRGEVRERQAVLRSLAALPQPESLVDLAVDACRTNVLTIFEAIACDNAYPARYFADAAFFQMVLKALFVGAPVARIVGLAERTTAELERMVEAFASERRAAGRPVPDDASLIRRSS